MQFDLNVTPAILLNFDGTTQKEIGFSYMCWDFVKIVLSSCFKSWSRKVSTDFHPHDAACRWGTTPMGSLESFGGCGARDREKSGTSRQHKGDLPRFGPQRCVKPYDPALVDVFSVLELLN